VAISGRFDAAMLSYRAPIREIRFLLDDVLAVDRYDHLAPYREATVELRATVLDGAGRMAEEVMLPVSALADREGCSFADERVTLPTAFRTAYRKLVDDGWTGLGLDPEYGGQGLPKTLADAVREIQISANMNLSGYLQLSESVYMALREHGSDEQRDTYLPKLATGEATGAMHLTEAHAGSDLGLIRTRASLASDGSYRLNGTKTFISCAEHDLTPDSVNLVLARIAGDPPGSRGTSLFLVPRLLERGDGVLRNGVRLTGLEHKLGLHASATGTITFEDAVGYLVGQPGEGLKAMFTMVNETRLSVGLQGLAIAEIALQNAAAYADERLQGRAPEGPRNPDLPADPIVVQPDIERRLTEMRGFTEAGRHLALWAALQLDISRHDPDPMQRELANDLAALMTPVIKAHFTDRGFAIADDAIQVYGGHGYIREQGIEQLMRDVRATRIYEGTNAILALDLVRRRLDPSTTAAPAVFFRLVDAAIAELSGEMTADLRQGLSIAIADLREATDWCVAAAKSSRRDLAAAAGDYLELFGTVALGWSWAQLAATSARHISNGVANDDDGFYLSKLRTARYFAIRHLSRSSYLKAQIALGESGLTSPSKADR
jgi:alkylation response protein AidB-like acyl-CoA dehydrogenase